MAPRGIRLLTAVGWLVGVAVCAGQESATTTDTTVDPPVAAAPVPVPVIPAPVAIPLNEARILGVMPDYQTVRDSSRAGAPMTAAREVASGVEGDHRPLQHRQCGHDRGVFAARQSNAKVWRRMGELRQEVRRGHRGFRHAEFLQRRHFRHVLHQDPRYFRKGPAPKSCRGCGIP